MGTVATWLRHLVGLAILTGIYLGSSWAVGMLRVPFPGSLAGLLLCALLIHNGLLPVRWVEGAAHLLLRHLPLLFLPVVAAIGDFWPLLRRSGLGLVPMVVVTTGLVLIVTGLTAERLGRGTEQTHVDRAS